jgi:hypothetical protein
MRLAAHELAALPVPAQVTVAAIRIKVEAREEVGIVGHLPD